MAPLQESRLGEADPYKVNSRKLPQNPQADNIRPYTHPRILFP